MAIMVLRPAVPALFLAAVLGAGCGGSGDDGESGGAATAKETATASAELPPGRIAFRRFLDDAQSHGAIFTISTDGTSEQQVTDPPAGVVDDQPAWSPDGKRIAFERCEEDGPCKTFIVRASGGDPQEVKPRCRLKPICEFYGPAWTPAGGLVATRAEGRERTSPAGEVWIERSSLVLVDLDDGRQQTILMRDGWSGDTHTPDVSPDGDTVVYSRLNSWRSKPPEGAAVFTVGLDGTRNRRVAPWRLGDGDHPVFGPDGTILFRSFGDDEDVRQSDFWTVRADGSELEQLTNFEDDTLVRSASYSPDGAWIVHASDGVGGNADLFVMRSDGTDNQPLTRTELWESAADWAPTAE